MAGFSTYFLRHQTKPYQPFVDFTFWHAFPYGTFERTTFCECQRHVLHFHLIPLLWPDYSTEWAANTMKGVDTMTRNMQKKLADAQEFAKKLDKLDRTQLI